MKRKLLAAAFLMTSTISVGCAGGAYYASFGPPPPRYGVAGVAPGPGYVWTDGYWNWTGGNWAWVGGRWMRPPHPGAMWVAPRWHQEGRRWRRERGYWRR
jgi:hypothetical protein